MKTLALPFLFCALLAPAAAGLLAPVHALPVPLTAAAPDPSAPLPAGHPKIGLVLAGGGALGGVHIGVLRVLEENRIPIHAIAGTSFGAIIGGLYAAGLPLEEVEDVAFNSNWEDLLALEIPRAKKPLRRKQEESDFLVRYGLRIDDEGKPALPAGLIPEQHIYLLLNRLLGPASTSIDFQKDLAIPFACVATDFEKAEEVVLTSGHLPRSILASMAVPGVFSPVEIDGLFLVDGGLVNNVPVSVLRRLHPDLDYIIVVDITSDYLTRDKMTSYLDSLSQTLRILTRANGQATVSTLRPNEILIQPDIAGLNGADFDDIETPAARGYNAAQDVLLPKNLPTLAPSDYAAYATRYRRRLVSPHPPIQSISVQQDSYFADSVVNRRLSTLLGRPFDPQKAEADIEAIYNLGTFARIEYEFVAGPTGGDYQVRAFQKRGAANRLRFGLALEENFEDLSTFRLGVEYTRFGLNQLGAEWRTTFRIGRNDLLATEWYQPLESSLRWFALAGGGYEERNFNFYQSGDILSQFRVRQLFGQAFLGRQFGNIADFRLGFRAAFRNAKPIINPLPETLDDFVNAFVVRGYFDTLDTVDFPHRGHLLKVEYERADSALGSDSDFSRLTWDLQTYRTWGPHTLNLGLIGGTNFDDSSRSTEDLFLGGFGRLSGYGRDELNGPHALLLRAFYYYRLLGGWEAKDKGLPIYFGVSLEHGNVFTDDTQFELDSFLWAGSAFIGANTVFGPLILSYGLSEPNARSFYLSLGERF